MPVVAGVPPACRTGGVGFRAKKTPKEKQSLASDRITQRSAALACRKEGRLLKRALYFLTCSVRAFPLEHSFRAVKTQQFIDT